MITQRAILLATFLMAFATGNAASGTSGAPLTPTVKLKILAGRPVVENVFLDGQGPFRFLLDTGAQTNQLEIGLARRLALTATFQVDLETAAGTAPAKGGRVGNVSLGPAAASDQEFLFTELTGLHALSPDLRGILGQEFLAHFDYTLDFQNHRLVFGDVPETGLRIPVRTSDGRMTVPTSQGDLVLDSGTNGLVLFRQPSAPASGQIRVASGLFATVSVERGPELRIGDRSYRPMDVIFDVGTGTQTAGLLPVSLFHAIFISNSGKYVMIDPLAGGRSLIAAR